MNNKLTPPGYVPVILHLPKELAERFQKCNYDWTSLIYWLTHELSPSEVADSLLSFYFDYTQLQPNLPESLKTRPEQSSDLYCVEKLYRAILALEKKEEAVCVLQ